MSIAPRVVLLGMLALALPGMSFAQHAHPAAHGGDTAPTPAPTARWTADAALRDGMGRIHVALEELRHYEMGHMDATMALDRVDLIERAAADIFATCKLPADRDAMLHRMLVSLLAAAQKLKADPADVAQVQAMRVALADYPHYFADPGWSAAATH